MFYSKSKNGFYTPEIHGDNMPFDCVFITDEQHAALLGAQAEGKVISSDDLGNPVAVEPIPRPTQVPEKVTMRQARLALSRAGRLNDVPIAIETLPTPQKEEAQIEWEFASDVERNSELTALLGAALGYNAAQLDELFIAASAI